MASSSQTQGSQRASIHEIDGAWLITQGGDAPKILIVKLSSLGDVLHTLPIVWDLRKRLPQAQIDWIVEEAYVPLL